MQLNVAGTRAGLTALQLSSAAHGACSPHALHKLWPEPFTLSPTSNILMSGVACVPAGGVPLDVLEAGLAMAVRALPSNLSALEAAAVQVCCGALCSALE